MRSLFWLLTLSLGLMSCSLLSPLPRESHTNERLSVFPKDSLPLEGKVTIYWNKYLIPYISAETEGDGAFALGLVHAHLRLSQMEMLRKVSQGRLSEMAGPFTSEIDQTLRILQLNKAVPEIKSQMPSATLRWVQRFVDGINHYKSRVKRRPVDFVALSFDEEKWTVEDVIGFTRLAGVDVSWIMLGRYLSNRNDPQYQKYWNEFMEKCAGREASFGSLQGAEQLLGAGRIGSNSLVIGGSRSKSGKPLVANDPHLGIPVPNLWLIAGIKTPSVQAVGLMFPGAPFVALGRNRHMAWGGTNMRALSSELVDVSGEDASQWKTRKEDIGVRFWFDTDIEAKDTPWGPLISESPLLNSKKEKLALKWVGHEPSDELTAFYKMNRSSGWREFRDAFATYAVGAQNFLFADVEGNIGQVLAARLPKRTGFPEKRVTLTPKELESNWSEMLGPLELPFVRNPVEGFVASANNIPTKKTPLGRYFSSDSRVTRLKELAAQRKDWTVESLGQVQQDVFHRGSVELRDQLAPFLKSPALRNSVWGRALLEWDGHYHAEARGPVAYQTFLSHLLDAAFEEEFGEKVVKSLKSGDCYGILLRDRFRQERGDKVKMVEDAAKKAQEDFARFESWGDMHRVRLSHLLGNAPLIGGRYQFVEYAGDGSADTILKTAHPVARDRHYANYGAQARHLSDLSDPDANYFVLLGGQDGWIRSQHMVDQVPLWLDGKHIQVPLLEETVKKRFLTVMNLSANGGGERK